MGRPRYVWLELRQSVVDGCFVHRFVSDIQFEELSDMRTLLRLVFHRASLGSVLRLLSELRQSQLQCQIKSLHSINSRIG